eukprot:37896-Eustigmatos_ZCMA.PRE.1
MQQTLTRSMVYSHLPRSAPTRPGSRRLPPSARPWASLRRKIEGVRPRCREYLSAHQAINHFVIKDVKKVV